MPPPQFGARIAAGTRQIAVRLLVGVALVAAGTRTIGLSARESPAELRTDRSFEVASVKEHRAALDAPEASRPRIRRHPAGHFEASRVTLRQVIVDGYGVRPYQVVDAPEWVLTDHFDIDARAARGSGPSDTDAMVRRLLEDRFGLVVRHETRRMPIYSLEVADRRLGPGIRRPSPQCESAAAAQRTTPPAADPPLRRDGLPECQHAWGIRGPGWIFVRYGPLSSLLGMLASSVGRPVVDRTGLAGLHDIDLRFAPEIDVLLAQVGGAAPVDDVSVFTAVREQLGMTLRPREGVVPVLAIVQVRRPSPD